MDTNRDRTDWHPADVVAALRKRGWSLRRLSVEHGRHPSALSQALHSASLPSYEDLIAAAIGVPASEIWPARYAARAANPRRVRRPRNNSLARAERGAKAKD